MIPKRKVMQQAGRMLENGWDRMQQETEQWYVLLA
jgi:hypothetical protein